MSFAIIETGGKQYKVSASKILEIEKLKALEEDELEKLDELDSEIQDIKDKFQ